MVWNLLLCIAAVLVICLFWVMIYDSNRFVIRHYEIADQKIKQNCRIAVIADLHDKCYGKDNDSLVAAIREQKPDIIVLAGDIMTARRKEKLDRALRFIGRISEICPVYYANGNHEHRLKLYPETYGLLAEEYESALRKIGVQRFVNAYTVLKAKGIAIYGSEIGKEYFKRRSAPTMKEGYLTGLLGKPDENLYTILIAHNPDYFLKYAGWGADLTFSGHIHGGVIRIPFVWRGVFSPAIRFFPKYDGGLFEEGEKKMIVSRGLGIHTIPFRLFNPGELVIADCLCKESTGQKRSDNGNSGKIGSI